LPVGISVIELIQYLEYSVINPDVIFLEAEFRKCRSVSKETPYDSYTFHKNIVSAEVAGYITFSLWYYGLR
jgi:hypothetical protein